MRSSAAKNATGIIALEQRNGPTQFAGVVFDHRSAPLANVRLSITRTNLAVTTDAEGKFAFEADVPPGKIDLFIDGRNVTNANNQQYPSLHFELNPDFPLGRAMMVSQFCSSWQEREKSIAPLLTPRGRDKWG